jgi:hypothetical protein
MVEHGFFATYFQLVRVRVRVRVRARVRIRVRLGLVELVRVS